MYLVIEPEVGSSIPGSRASLGGLGQAAQSWGVPRRREWSATSEYSLPGKPWGGKGYLKSELT